MRWRINPPTLFIRGIFVPLLEPRRREKNFLTPLFPYGMILSYRGY